MRMIDWSQINRTMAVERAHRQAECLAEMSINYQVSSLAVPIIESEVLPMSPWLLNIVAGLYLSLLYVVHKEQVYLILWLLGFCLLTHHFRKSR